MSELKKEIKKAIGDTTSHKDKVWQSLQQPKRKNRMPLFITAALVALASIWLLLLQFPTSNEPTTSMEIGVTNESKDGIPYTLLFYGEQKPAYINNDFAISHATTEEEYKKLSEQFKVAFIEGIDFTKHDILFALYTTDGCGLIIDQLTKAEQTIQIHLALPADLRNEKEINCTAIAAPHLAVIEIEKQAVQQATFVERDKVIATDFNTLAIEQVVYHFDLLLNPDVIHSIKIKDLVNNRPISVDQDAIKNDIARLTAFATPMSGIVDMIEPHYQISVQTNDGRSQHVYVWIYPKSDQVVIMSSKDTHYAYTIPKSDVQFLLAYLN